MQPLVYMHIKVIQTCFPLILLLHKNTHKTLFSDQREWKKRKKKKKAIIIIDDEEDKGRSVYMEVHGLKTELCLGLPGGGDAVKVTGKRGFSETVDLKLNLQSDESEGSDLKENSAAEKSAVLPKNPVKPPAKAQMVGWPPVRSFRKNVMANQKSSNEEEAEKKAAACSGGAAFVKVSMDGAPYLRKVDLKMYTSYQQLSDALAKMFSSFTMGNYGTQGMIDFMNESKLMDLLNSSEYVPTYEDKDGDWMLVGDVPWEMFVNSCKRLRIMKGSEAIGLAPRAMEKCKSRC